MDKLKSPSNSRIILSLGLSQALNSACVPISVIVASLSVVELAGGDGRWAGVPAALIMAGGALASFNAGRVLPAVGYRKALVFAGLSGISGSALAGYASIQGRLLPFLAAFLLLGVAIGLVGFSRYAAAEVSLPAAKARAIGRVVLGSTAGAILGPLLVPLFGDLALALGFPRLAGPWLATSILYGLVALNTSLLLRPEPKTLARQLQASGPVAVSASQAAAPARPLSALLRDRAVLLPMASMVTAQVAMVLVMAITPLHMHSHHHPMGTISQVIAAHFVGMYGLSVLSGWLADKLGRMRTVGLGGAVLGVSCVLAPLSQGMPALMASLFLLGLGWSFCFIGGSSALSSGLADRDRSRVQGVTEASVSLTSGAASLSSGILFASFGFPAMTKVGLVASILPLVFFLVSRPARPAAVSPKAAAPGS